MLKLAYINWIEFWSETVFS